MTDEEKTVTAQMINVIAVKLAKGGGAEVTYINECGDEVSLKGENLIHSDLREAMKGLEPFLLERTEQREAVSMDWNDPHGTLSDDAVNYCKSIKCTGLKIGGSDTSPGVKLIGSRVLECGRVSNLDFPFTGFDPDTEQYERCGDLELAVKNVQYEAALYAVEKKWGEPEQLSINFDAAPENATEDDPFGADATDEQIAEGIVNIIDKAM